MHMKPPPGRVYRDPATNQLVPDHGFEPDPHNLDHARAIACGDLVPVSPARKSARGSATAAPGAAPGGPTATPEAAPGGPTAATE